MDGKNVHGRFAMVVIDDYDDPTLKLSTIAGHAARVSALFRERGFEEDHRSGGTSAHEVRDWLDRWKPSTRRLLLYWTGHAQAGVNDIALFCGDYEPGKTFAVISGRDLGELLAKRSAVDIVVIIDTCKSGIGVDTIITAFKHHVGDSAVGLEPGLAVLTSARDGELARDGVFTSALEHVLRKGPPTSTDTYNGWTAHDASITPEELFVALTMRLNEVGAFQQPEFSQARSVGRFFPFFTNHQHQPHLPDATVETLRDHGFAESDLLEHFLIKFRGIDTLTADGWYYAPRPGPQTHITAWLRDGDGMLVVTGPPGSGKSALLGWLAAMSSPDYRQHAVDKTNRSGSTEPPPEGVIDAGVHAKQHTLQECVNILGEALELIPPAGGWQEPGPLVEQIAERAERESRTITILLDALDEAHSADQTRIAVDLLAALAKQQGVRVIVGTRPNREDPTQRTTETTPPDGPWTADGPLIRALTPDCGRVIRLDTDPGSTHSITTYITNRLLDATTASPYLHHSHELAKMTAATIAEHSDGIFLFARLLARSLISRAEPLGLTDSDTTALFNGGVAEAFAADLTNYGADRDRVYDLLAPLAWAEGAGLPRRDIWLALANALARPGIIYTEQDIAWVLEHAGAHIIESGEDGQTVYRLYHQAFNDYFQHNINHIHVQATITHALLELTQRP
ncbi:AAA family ATPase [Nocardia sp. NPDC049526]|uniref:AAA family ATPase n=1 Tax=Nocardia sp. NPDC049526 TaxID=3364316 RepID=UPI0037A6BEAF